jgi:S-adenosylmethionine:tRNA ribosyltransferase-isomerase
VSGALAFTVPPALEAAAPPEARGVARDGVRLMVAQAGAAPAHVRFRDLPTYLRRGDLLVVNESATLPAALPGRLADGTAITLHLSTPEPGGERWVVELRRDGARFRAARAGDVVGLPAGGVARLHARFLAANRLWLAELELPAPLLAYLHEHGDPIRYAHQREARPLADHQTVFARVPGSAEMPSAGRPFTERLLDALAARGVGVAPVVLHTGVSSQERGERPYPERYAVSATTAARVNAARRAGGRVIAVGTTVTRALETVAAPDGTVAAGAGWTALTITPERGVRAVDGLITGWHEPDASHLLLLEAVAGRALVERCYAAALALRYRWHEFGDTHLLLP